MRTGFTCPSYLTAFLGTEEFSPAFDTLLSSWETTADGMESADISFSNAISQGMDHLLKKKLCCEVF